MAELRRESEKLATSCAPGIDKRQSKSGVEFAFHNADRVGTSYLSAIAGDVIHNLRSALDQTASEMARIKGKSDASVYFPFASKEADLDQIIKCKNFHFAGDSAVAHLKSLKPFRGGNILLRCIHDFDIEDKHRSLISISQQVATPMLNIGSDSEPFGTTFQTLLSFNCRIDSVLSGNPIIETLENMIDLVESIVKSFSELK